MMLWEPGWERAPGVPAALEGHLLGVCIGAGAGRVLRSPRARGDGYEERLGSGWSGFEALPGPVLPSPRGCRQLPGTGGMENPGERMG